MSLWFSQNEGGLSTILLQSMYFFSCLIKAFLEEMEIKSNAPGEARTHGLQIMRLTRCLLRYGGLVKVIVNIGFHISIKIPTGILEYNSPPLTKIGEIYKRQNK